VVLTISPKGVANIGNYNESGESINHYNYKTEKEARNLLEEQEWAKIDAQHIRNNEEIEEDALRVIKISESLTM